jgi:hypothetical protein
LGEHRTEASRTPEAVLKAAAEAVGARIEAAVALKGKEHGKVVELKRAR